MQSVLRMSLSDKRSLGLRPKEGANALWSIKKDFAPIFVRRNGSASKPILGVNFTPWRHEITRNEQNPTNTRRDRVDQSCCLARTRRLKSELEREQDLRHELLSTLSLRVFVRFCSFCVIPYLYGLKFIVSIGFDGFPFLYTKIRAPRDKVFFLCSRAHSLLPWDAV